MWSVSRRITHLFIKNVRFIENQRAIDIKGRYHVNTHIEGCNFQGNEVFEEGAAIRVTDRIQGTLTVVNTIFVNNQAGVNPFNMPVIHTNEVISFHRMSNVTGYEQNHKKIQIHMINTYTKSGHVAEDMRVEQIVTFHFNGKGGAISITTLYDFLTTLNNCTMISNMATAYGGTIYGEEFAVFELQNSLIEGLSKAHSIVQGDIIYSTGRFYITDSKIISHYPLGPLPIVYYKNQESRNFFKIHSMVFHCPGGSKLQYENVSNDLNDIAVNELDLGTLAFSTFIFRCLYCDYNFYAYDSGKIEVKHINSNSTKMRQTEVFDINHKNHEVEVYQPRCNMCPYGGFCQKSKVRAKPNYWGWMQDGEVKFHLCPSDYCCENTNGCTSYDDCAPNRHGPLCGRCRPGYSQAMFTVKCIPNSECNDKWVLYLTFFLAIIYSLFLLFQDALESILYSAPIGKVTMLENLKCRKTAISADQDLKPNTWSKNMYTTGQGNSETKLKDLANASEEGGIFLILLFYYFQDAGIIHFKTIFVDADPDYLVVIRDIVGGLFDFQINAMQFADSVCIHPVIIPLECWHRRNISDIRTVS